MSWRALLFLPPIAVGIALFMWMTKGDDSPTIADVPEAALAVRVSTVAPQDFVASASGFGRVKAIETWHAISQVSGRALEVSPDVVVGELVKAGELLVRIDPRDYEIALSKAKTGVASARAGLQELDAVSANTKATLELEQEIEAFYQTELDRQLALLERGTVSQATLDKARRTLLTQQKMVLGLKNALTLVPVQKQSLEASLGARLAEQEEAERALSNTEIRAPFDGRVVKANVAVQEFVRSGNTLLEMDNTAASEITAEFQPNVISSLFRSASIEVRAKPMNLTDLRALSRVLKSLKLKAQIEVTAGKETYVWPATIMRVNGATDFATGTLGVVVRIDGPGRPNPLILRPPLMNGSFARVTLTAPKKADTILVDRDALRLTADGSQFVYIANSDQRLERRNITLGPISGRHVVVTQGLEAGDTLVLSDPQPAIQGMLLDPVQMDRAQQ